LWYDKTCIDCKGCGVRGSLYCGGLSRVGLLLIIGVLGEVWGGVRVGHYIISGSGDYLLPLLHRVERVNYG